MGNKKRDYQSPVEYTHQSSDFNYNSFAVSGEAQRGIRRGIINHLSSIPINHKILKVRVQYISYGEWEQAGQVSDISKSMIIPSLPFIFS